MKQFADKSIEELLNLPLMTASTPLAVLRIVAHIVPAAYFAAPTLYPLLILSQVNASIQHGNAPISAFFYANYGVLLNVVLGDMEAADRVGKLALGMLEKLNAKETECRTRFILGMLVVHGTAPLETSLQLLRESYQIGLETGEIEFAGHAAFHICQGSYFNGQELGILERDIQSYSQMLTNLKQVTPFGYAQLLRQVALNLLGDSNNPWLLVGDVYDETQALPPLLAANDQMALQFFYLHKLILSYLFGDTAQALSDLATQGRQYSATGSITVPIFYFYDSLAALTEDWRANAKLGERLQQVVENQAKLQKWAHHAPMNHLHKWHLVEAERYRVLGQKGEAIDLYDRAIAAARTNKYINEEALTNELAAKFYLEWGKERIAQEYMIEAYYGYAHWGAKAKVADLEQRYPQLLASILQQQRSPLSVNETVFTMGAVTSTSSSASVSDTLDLATILKASQTLSSEIELDKLLSALLHTITQAAGADKCVLMLLEDDLLMVQAVAELKASGQIEAEVYPTAQPVEDSSELPISVVNTVRRSLQPAVITDATAHPQFTGNAYIQTHPIKSILCSPILQQGKLLGLVYLENSLVAGAFTRDRIELLNLLCAQAAISLENSRLYRQVQQSLEAARLMQFSIDRVATPVCWVEPDGRIAYANDALCQDWGYPRQEIVGHYVYDFNPSLSPETWAEHWQEIRQQGSVTAETQIRNKAGRLYPVEITVNYIAFKQQEYHLTFIVNISDRKRAEATMLQKSQALEQALHDLQQAQLQMIQSEKMSALGNLVAGVAHEINNPVGFIAGNLQPALEYVKDTFGLLELYQQEYPKPSAVIQAEIEAIDLDYIREDLPKLLDSMQLGVDRIRGISKSLRTFSRDDKDYKVPFNLHEGIDSTILMLKHRLKDNGDRPAIEVLTEYGHLPQIECFPGQLNQVFMNILANAIDMFDEMSQAQSLEQLPTNSLRITIQTERLGNQVLISIRDNGKGINEVAQTKIFDHLFTTKAVGKGTGLGLAIAHQIVVDKHGGSLEVQSTVGQGSEFCIRLPIGVK